jgi:hypothetical protein
MAEQETTVPAVPLLGEAPRQAVLAALSLAGAMWTTERFAVDENDMRVADDDPRAVGRDIRTFVDPAKATDNALAALEPLVAALVAEREQEAYSRGVDEGAIAERRTREQVAREIELTAARQAGGELPRPKFERGGFLNDWMWAAQVARDGAS